MPRYIALLRAINIRGRVVKMDRLRWLFEELGFAKVETFIASGNVIFDAPSGDAQALEQQIESHMKQSLGYEVVTFIRTPAELAVIAGCRPFPASEIEAEGNWLYIAFLPAAPSSQARDKLLTHRSEVDDFHVSEREVYWLCRRTLSQSTFSGAALERALGMPATLRNATTVRRLAAKYPPAS